MVYAALLRRDLGRSHVFTDPGKLDQPDEWTPDWVRRRLVEALTIERRLSDKRIGRAMIEAAWRHDPVDGLADRQPLGTPQGCEVWRGWAHMAGADAAEISRLEEALSWLGSIAVGRACRADAVKLLAWSYCIAHGQPLEALLRRRGWSRVTFDRSVGKAAGRIAAHLNAQGITVR